MQFSSPYVKGLAAVPLFTVLLFSSGCEKVESPAPEDAAVGEAAGSETGSNLPEVQPLPSTTLVTPEVDGRTVTDPNDLIATKAEPATPVACKTDAAFSLLGKPALDTTVQNILKDSGASTLRVLKPGDAGTTDFRADRLTINVDTENNITSVACG